jgi:hypothetical protein
MFTCILCRFANELDDVALRRAGGHCTCLRCFARETGSAASMPKTLRHQLITVLAQFDAAA